MSQVGYNIPLMGSSSKAQRKDDEDEEDAASAEPAGESKWNRTGEEDNRDYYRRIARLAMGQELCM
jgi:hypothetical protein